MFREKKRNLVTVFIDLKKKTYDRISREVM